MATSRSLLSLAVLSFALVGVGCKAPTSSTPTQSSAQEPEEEHKKESASMPAPTADPGAGDTPDVQVERDKDDAEDEMIGSVGRGDGGGGSANPKPSAASTDIITVADAGAGSVGREPAGGGEVEPVPEADPDEKAEDERPALPKPIFGDSEKASCRKSMQVGNKLKSFKLPSLDGKKTISSSGYRGRVVLVNFWATWCKPCIKELPDLDRLYRKYRNNGFTLVAVATDEEAEGVQKIVDDLKLAAKVAIAGEAAAAAYDHPNFPFSFVVDGEGEIVAAYEAINESCLSDLESVLRDELEKLD